MASSWSRLSVSASRLREPSGSLRKISSRHSFSGKRGSNCSCCTCMSICTSVCTTSGGVALRRSSSSSKLATEASGEGLRKSGQCLSRHIAASRGERSVPGRTRRVRVDQGACTVSHPWWSSTPKLVTVSQRALGARRTLVRSSVQRGIVIMVEQPSSNNTHNSLLHYPRALPAFQYLSQKPESIPFRGSHFYVVGS